MNYPARTLVEKNSCGRAEKVWSWKWPGGYVRIYGTETETESSAVTDQSPSGGTRAAEESRSKTAPPPLFRVLMHNDDFTSMDFVVEVLDRYGHYMNVGVN